MARMTIVTGDDPDALLRDACAPFCDAGVKRLPILALRQGGLRDAVYQMVAASGAAGWLGNPVLVFSELTALIAGDLAPLDDFERRALIQRAVGEQRSLDTLKPAARTRGFVETIDRLFGDLVAGEVNAATLRSALGTLGSPAWEAGRDQELVSLYESYQSALSDAPAKGGVARSDGRDTAARAADAVLRDSDTVRARLRRPFEDGSAPRSLYIYGLADLRRGWGRLVGALHRAPFIDELRVYLPAHAVSLIGELTEQAETTRRVRAAREFVPVLDHLRSAMFQPRAGKAQPSAELQIVAAPDITRELEAVARAVKARLLTGETQPNDIAIIARKARPYLTRAAQVLEGYGVPISARLRHTFTEIPVVTAFLRLLHLGADGMTLSALSEIAESPYFTAPLDVDAMRVVAGGARPRRVRSWNELFERRQARPVNADDDEALPEGRIADARAQFDKLAGEIAVLEEARPLVEWLDLTLRLLGAGKGDGQATVGILGIAANASTIEDERQPAILRAAAKIDTAALRGMTELLRSWRASLELIPLDTQKLDAISWAEDLEAVLRDEEVTVRVGTSGGVQLVEALAADGRSFSDVYLVGMSTGAFPSDVAPNAIFSESELVKLAAAGLPLEPSAVWYDREMALFQSLAAAPNAHLHLSYSYSDTAGTPQLPSAYLEEVISRFDPSAGALVQRIPSSSLAPASAMDAFSVYELERLAARSLRTAGSTSPAELFGSVAKLGGTARASQLLHAARVERVRVGHRINPPKERGQSAHSWNGLIADESLLTWLAARFGDRVWSATQLETIGRCGFSFFGKHVISAHAPLQDTEELDGHQYGSVVHAALAIVYRGLLDIDPENPVHPHNFDAARKLMPAAVQAAVDGAGGGWAANATVRAIRERELVSTLESYLYWEMHQNTKSPVHRPVEIEVGFGMRDSEHGLVKLERNGRTLKLRGTIDRIDEITDAGAEGFQYVVDHKAGESSLSPVGALREAGAILQVALYLAALRELTPGVKLWGGRYQIVNSPSNKAALDRCSFAGGKLKEVGTPTQQKAAALIEAAVPLSLSLIDSVLAGKFAARVPDGTGCLKYCAYRDACREDRVKA